MRLSVIIPALNEREHLPACLDALGRQGELVDEIIVVDNGSVDGTADLARSHEGVSVLTEPRRGISYARNTGFDAAAGDVFARIDADTIVRPGWAAAVLDAFSGDRALSGLGGPAGFTAVSGSGGVAGRSIYRAFRGIHRVTIGDGPLLYGHNMAISRRAWLDVRDLVSLGDTEASEDIDVALALLHLGRRIAFEPRMLVTVGIERTIEPRKLLRYYRTDLVTKAKYRALRESERREAGATAS